MANDLTAEDIARETYLFKYNMENGAIGAILTLVIGVPLLLILSLLGNGNNQNERTRAEISCTSCGAMVKYGHNFCTHCGVKR